MSISKLEYRLLVNNETYERVYFTAEECLHGLRELIDTNVIGLTFTIHNSAKGIHYMESSMINSVFIKRIEKILKGEIEV